MKEICPISGLVLLSMWISSCGLELPNSTDAAGTRTQPAHSLAKPTFMDNVPDKIFTGESNTTSRFGQEVMLGKDINGDGYGDMFIGAPYYKEIQGRVYIYYGGPNVSFDAPDLILTGEDDRNYFGHDIELADFNNDGHLDMAITALGNNFFQGRVYIYYGGPDFDPTADKIIDGELGTVGRFGREIAAGDINNDGCAELLVCADEINSKKGRVYLYYGAPGTDMDTTCDLMFDGENPDDRFGRSLALGKDIDGDGYGDMIIGSRYYPKGDCDGRAFLYYGAQGTSTDNISDLIFHHQSPGENFATDVDLFDIDNDNLADIIIAARRYDNIRGRVYIYWGTDRRNMDATPDKYLTGEDDYALFGGDNVDCGYVDNDEYGDILVAGKLYPNGKLKGRMYLYYGNTKALMDTICDMTFTGENDNDRFGYDVAIGDINGDDFGEILTGARTFKSESFQGRAYLYFGGPSPVNIEAVLEREENSTNQKRGFYPIVDIKTGL